MKRSPRNQRRVVASSTLTKALSSFDLRVCSTKYREPTLDEDGHELHVVVARDSIDVIGRCG